MLWTDRRVLVIGGAGFIGSHLSEALVDAGAEVTVFTRYTSHGHFGGLAYVPSETQNRIRMIFGDLRDLSAVETAVEGQETVFHLAAHIGIPYSYVHPLDVVQVNVIGTAHVLEGCRRARPEKVVLFSTSEVYGTAQYAPIDEAHPLKAQSPYAASKVASDQLGLSYFRSFGTPVAICRPFNTYGPRQPPRAILPTIISQGLNQDEIRLGSTAPTRDLVYVGDTVRGAMRIAEEEATIGEVVNLATGQDISVGDLAQAVILRLGGNKVITTDAARMRPPRSEVMRLIGDASKAERLLGWKPSTTLEQGINATIEWMKGTGNASPAKQYRI
jgi:dTDP-glucose 4,6-dehydratase